MQRFVGVFFGRILQHKDCSEYFLVTFSLSLPDFYACTAAPGQQQKSDKRKIGFRFGLACAFACVSQPAFLKWLREVDPVKLLMII